MENIQFPKSRHNKKYKHIGTKIGYVVALMQVLSVVLAMTICVLMFNSLVTKMQKDRCINGTNMLELELSRLTGDEDLNQVLDELENRMNCEFTIFEGDTRMYSTVTQDGKRVVGTQLSANLSELVLKQGKSYVGEADILGEKYLCSYVPTRGSDGQINGLIFAGVSTAEARQGTLLVITLAAIISIITILICMVVMAAFLKKRVSAPLDKITQMAHRLENGDLGLSSNEEITVSIQSDDEIGILAQVFENTTSRLRAYISDLSRVLSAIAQGNLTQQTTENYMGDFLAMKTSLDSIQAALNRTMGQIVSSAVQVSSGSDQVASSAQALAQGATEQASSIQEISATITDISSNANQTAEAAAEAGKYVDRAGAQLGVSIEYVKDLNVAMENISGSSKEISTIIATIENIAFQINILALNAAVEAARAGSAGKGFAVVADEVSNLASKSDEAAKATKKLISSSISAVTEGGEVVNKVTEALELTGQHAGNVTKQMAIVVEEVDKLSNAISQVTDGVDQISAVVQTNSATSEQCAAASEELSSQAGLLKNLMNAFQLRGSHF